MGVKRVYGGGVAMMRSGVSAATRGDDDQERTQTGGDRAKVGVIDWA